MGPTLKLANAEGTIGCLGAAKRGKLATRLVESEDRSGLLTLQLGLHRERRRLDLGCILCIIPHRCLSGALGTGTGYGQ